MPGVVHLVGSDMFVPVSISIILNRPVVSIVRNCMYKPLALSPGFIPTHRATD